MDRTRELIQPGGISIQPSKTASSAVRVANHPMRERLAGMAG